MLNRLIQICKTVGNKLGKGFSETVYQEGIALNLRKSSIDYSKEVVLPITYEQIVIGNVRADIVLPNDEIIIECKAIDGNLKQSHIPQLINYLEITNYTSGILVNFNQNPAKDIVEVVTVERSSETAEKLYKAIHNEKTIYLTDRGFLVTNDPENQQNLLK